MEIPNQLTRILKKRMRTQGILAINIIPVHKHHAMKTYAGVEEKLHAFINLEVDKVSGRFFPGINSRCPLGKVWVSPREFEYRQEKNCSGNQETDSNPKSSTLPYDPSRLTNLYISICNFH